jgi:hypothetical protein
MTPTDINSVAISVPSCHVQYRAAIPNYIFCISFDTLGVKIIGIQDVYVPGSLISRLAEISCLSRLVVSQIATYPDFVHHRILFILR